MNGEGWSGHFRAWVERTRPVAWEFLNYRLRGFPLFAAELTTVMDRALESAIRVAEDRQRFIWHSPEYSSFLKWFLQESWRCGLRELFTLDVVVREVERLPEVERSLTHWLYVDQFPDYQLSALLRKHPRETVTREDVRRRALQNYRVLCHVIRGDGWGYDDDHMTFPQPPILIGLTQR